jgi:hypothetical protein
MGGWQLVVHGAGDLSAGIMVVALPEIAKAAYTVDPSGLTAIARGPPPNTFNLVTSAWEFVSNTSIRLSREMLT